MNDSTQTVINRLELKIRDFIIETYFWENHWVNPEYNLRVRIGTDKTYDNDYRHTLLAITVNVINHYMQYGLGTNPDPASDPNRHNHFVIRLTYSYGERYFDETTRHVHLLADPQFREYEAQRINRLFEDEIFELIKAEAVNHIDNAIQQGSQTWGRKQQSVQFTGHRAWWRLPDISPIESETNWSMGTSWTWVNGGFKPETITKAAYEKAEILLLRLIKPAQKETWVNLKYIEALGSETGRLYIIEDKPQINVVCYDDGQYVCKYCTVPTKSVPQPDHILTQVLLIENDENKFLEIAHRWA